MTSAARWRNLGAAVAAGLAEGLDSGPRTGVIDLELGPDGSFFMPGVVTAAELEELERMSDDGDELRAESRLKLLREGRRR